MIEQPEREKHRPNKIARSTRVMYVLFSIFLFLYGASGVAKDDLFLPGKRTEGSHFHGWSVWILFGAILCTIANMTSVVIDHYDQRNNEHKYKRFAQNTFLLSFCLFLLACITEVLSLYHQPKPAATVEQSLLPSDTVRFGSYYNTSFGSEIGYMVVTNEQGETITHFKNDTTYKVKISLTGRNMVPFKAKSLNYNLLVSSAEEPNTYWITVIRQAPDTIDLDNKKMRYDAQLALIANNDSVDHYFTNRYWNDSTKTSYKEYTLKLDTIAVEYMQIKDE